MKFKPTFYPILVVCALSISSCSQRRPVDIDNEIRDPSEHEDSVIQIAPMVPEAVQILIAEADSQLQQGFSDEAILTLQRALSISPASSLVQQHLAEVYLSQGAYQQAFEWSDRVAQNGPTHGSICERARRTLALAAEMLNDVETQSQALESIASCTQPTIEKF